MLEPELFMSSYPIHLETYPAQKSVVLLCTSLDPYEVSIKKYFGICQLSFNKQQFSCFITKIFSSLEESGGRKSYLSLTYDLQHATFTTFYTSLPCPLVTVIYGKTTANMLQAKYEFKNPLCLFHWVNVHTSAPSLQLRLWGSIKNKNVTPGQQRILIAFLIEAELPKI